MIEAWGDYYERANQRLSPLLEYWTGIVRQYTTKLNVIWNSTCIFYRSRKLLHGRMSIAFSHPFSGEVAWRKSDSNCYSDDLKSQKIPSVLRQERITDHDPMQHIDTPKKAQKLPSTLTLTEVESWLKHLIRQNVRDKRSCNLGSHVCYWDARQWIDWIEIGRSSSFSWTGTDSWKGDKERIIPLGDYAIQWLERYLDEARPLLVKDASEMHVFVNNHGKGLSRQGIWKIWSS